MFKRTACAPSFLFSPLFCRLSSQLPCDSLRLISLCLLLFYIRCFTGLIYNHYMRKESISRMYYLLLLNLLMMLTLFVTICFVTSLCPPWIGPLLIFNSAAA